MMQPCDSCLNEFLPEELSAFQGEKLCASCLAEKRASPVKKVLLSPLGIAAALAAVVPFGMHATSVSSVTENGVLVSEHYRDFVAIAGGGLAMVLGLALGASGRGTKAVRWGVALVILAVGGWHVFRGFGLDRPQPQAPQVEKEVPPPEVCAEETPKFCAKPCEAGEAGACDTLGVALANGKGLEKDEEQALAAFEKACSAGKGLGCRHAGLMLTLESVALPKDEARALGFWKKGCEAGDASSCNEGGVLLDNAQGASKDSVAAAALFQKACDLKSSGGCKNLALLYDVGRGVERNQARALELYEKACAGGEAEACNDTGVSYRNGEGTEKNAAKALEFFEKACQGKSASACSNLGVMLREGESGEKDEARVRELFEQGCNGGSASGCDHLGMLMVQATGEGRDVARAEQLFQKACDGGALNGCANLGVLYRGGEGLEKDEEKAVAVLEKGCEGKHEKSCALLGLTLADLDPVRARPLLQDSCKDGYKDACKALKGLGKKKAASTKRRNR